MAKRVRVASRALKRGRGLRSSAARDPIDRARADEEEPEAETVPEGRASHEGADDLEGVDEAEDSPRRSNYSRPPAPAFDFSAGASLEELAAMSTGASDSSRERETLPAIPAAFLAEDDELLSTTLESHRDPEMLDEPALRSEQSSLTPVVAELAPESPAPESSAPGSVAPESDVAPQSVTPAQRQRRTRLRRLVGFAVAAVAVLTVGLGTKAAVTGTPAYAQRHAATAAATLADEAPAAMRATPEISEAAPAAAPDEATELPDGPTASGDYDAVRKETLLLLNSRKFSEAVTQAQRLIQLEPGKAFGYRCLGSAYQDMGKMKDAQQAYNDCVRVAKKGDVQECSLLGGTAK